MKISYGEWSDSYAHRQPGLSPVVDNLHVEDQEKKEMLAMVRGQGVNADLVVGGCNSTTPAIL